MTIDYSSYDEYSWEWSAWHLIRHHDMDVPKGSRSTFEELYKGEKFALMANKAWNDLRASGVDWEISDQVKLLATKQHDYGHRNIEMFGIDGVRVRLWDKVARFENLASRELVNHESVEDTLKDIIGYVVLYFMVRNGTFSYTLATLFDGDVITLTSDEPVTITLPDSEHVPVGLQVTLTEVPEEPSGPGEDEEWVKPTYGQDTEVNMVDLASIIPTETNLIKAASPPPPDLKNDIPKEWKLSQTF